MEAKATLKPISAEIPITWIYKGEDDKENVEFNGKGVTLELGYKGKLGLSQAPGKNIPM